MKMQNASTAPFPAFPPQWLSHSVSFGNRPHGKQSFPFNDEPASSSSVSGQKAPTRIYSSPKELASSSQSSSHQEQAAFASASTGRQATPSSPRHNDLDLAVPEAFLVGRSLPDLAQRLEEVTRLILHPTAPAALHVESRFLPIPTTDTPRFLLATAPPTNQSGSSTASPFAQNSIRGNTLASGLLSLFLLAGSLTGLFLNITKNKPQSTLYVLGNTLPIIGIVISIIGLVTTWVHSWQEHQAQPARLPAPAQMELRPVRHSDTAFPNPNPSTSSISDLSVDIDIP